VRRYPYELVAGHPALDFLNTLDDWTAVERLDRLRDFQDVVAFAAAASILRPAEARRLEDHGGGVAELRQLREVRERLARVFQAVISSAAPDAADLDRLARDAARSAGSIRLRHSRGGHGGLTRSIELDDAGAAVVRWRIVDSAVALLTSETLAGVKSCPGCGWFFIDTTKNRSRRWCSMSTCGSAVKARRYYRRRKTRRST